MTRFTSIVLGVASLSVAGLAFINSIRESAQFVPGSQIITGNQFIVPDSGTTTAPGVYLNDETTPIKTYPVAYGTEYCEGHTGALICSITVKLTGSGGHRNNNAGSFVCTTSTCSMLDIQVHSEAIPRNGGDRLYLGWTNSPGTQSGAQFITAGHGVTLSGQILIGSGSYFHPTGRQLVRNGQVPPGATVKAVWQFGNGTEHYGSYVSAARFTYMKFYRP